MCCFQHYSAGSSSLCGQHLLFPVWLFRGRLIFVAVLLFPVLSLWLFSMPFPCFANPGVKRFVLFSFVRHKNHSCHHKRLFLVYSIRKPGSEGSTISYR